MYISRDFPDLTILRLDGFQVPSTSRISFVKEIIISCYSASSGTLKQINSKFKNKLACLSYSRGFKVPGTITFNKRFPKLVHKNRYEF